MKHFYLLLAVAAFMTQPLSASEWEPEQSMDAPVPSDMEWLDDREGIETEIGAITMTVTGSQIRVTNASGQTLEIYNLTGVRVATVRIDSDDKTLNINLPKGCYMIKIGKVVRKVPLR